MSYLILMLGSYDMQDRYCHATCQHTNTVPITCWLWPNVSSLVSRTVLSMIYDRLFICACLILCQQSPSYITHSVSVVYPYYSHWYLMRRSFVLDERLISTEWVANRHWMRNSINRVQMTVAEMCPLRLLQWLAGWRKSRKTNIVRIPGGGAAVRPPTRKQDNVRGCMRLWGIAETRKSSVGNMTHAERLKLYNGLKQYVDICRLFQRFSGVMT